VNFIQNYPDYELWLARTQLLCFMLGMGATLTAAQFTRILRQPRSLIVAAVTQLFGMPLLALGIAQLCGLKGGEALGLIIVAGLPGSALSKLFTFLGRGNIALSISLSVLTTLASLVTMPLLLRLLASGYIPDMPEDFHMPTGEMMLELALFLLLPLATGMVIGRVSGNGGLAKTVARVSFLIGVPLVAVMVAGSLASGRIHPASHGIWVPLTIILFCVLAQQLSMLPFRIFGWPKPDRLAVGIEVTMRNINLALLLIPILFPPHDERLEGLAEGVLFVSLFYAATAMGVGLPLALRHRRSSHP
jgi:bile acid:Na+ symporter, BASS family